MQALDTEALFVCVSVPHLWGPATYRCIITCMSVCVSSPQASQVSAPPVLSFGAVNVHVCLCTCVCLPLEQAWCQLVCKACLLEATYKARWHGVIILATHDTVNETCTHTHTYTHSWSKP